VQWVGQEIRVLDYIEGQGQVLATTPTRLEIAATTRPSAICPMMASPPTQSPGFVSYADHLPNAEFNVTVIPNQGSGAAAMRIEAVRRIFPKVWFNEETTEAGRDALGYYHERKDK
jgi:phage terminase large subunit